jgi:uncharacterized Tic20 family protein
MNSYQQQVRTWSMLCHLAALAGLIIPFGSILGPLVVWQIKKSELPEINPHGKESLNFQITVTIIVLIISAFLFGSLGYGAFFGSPVAMFAGAFGLGSVLSLIRLISWVLVILASIRANNGELFHYPSFKFIR